MRCLLYVLLYDNFCCSPEVKEGVIMSFAWEDMFNKTSKQVKDSFHEITKQVNQLIDSDLPDFPKNNRPWGCKCGTIVDSKYDFCPKCGTSKKELINSFLEKQSIQELEDNRKNAKTLLNENQRMKQEINLLTTECSDLQSNLDITKGKLTNLQSEYNKLKSKYRQIQKEINSIRMTNETSKSSYSSTNTNANANANASTNVNTNAKTNTNTNTNTNTSTVYNRDYMGISYPDFLHDVYDKYNNSIQDETKSLGFFNIAVDYKRAGKFSEAIDMQVKSIRYYLFDPEILNNFYSMAKTYYLMCKYADSLNCYRIYLQLCILKSPDIANDFHAANDGIIDAAIRLNMIFRNLFKNMGHSMYDEKNKKEKGIEINYYRSELVNNPLINPQYKMMSENYEKELINLTAPSVFDDMQKMIDYPNKTLPEIKTMMLHYTRLI